MCLVSSVKNYYKYSRAETAMIGHRKTTAIISSVWRTTEKTKRKRSAEKKLMWNEEVIKYVMWLTDASPVPLPQIKCYTVIALFCSVHIERGVFGIVIGDGRTGKLLDSALAVFLSMHVNTSCYEKNRVQNVRRIGVYILLWYIIWIWSSRRLRSSDATDGLPFLQLLF